MTRWIVNYKRKDPNPHSTVPNKYSTRREKQRIRKSLSPRIVTFGECGYGYTLTQDEADRANAASWERLWSRAGQERLN